MAKICGTPEEARQVSGAVKQAGDAIEKCVGGLEQDLSTVRSGWNDEGIQEVEEMISSIRSALNKAGEAIPALQKALDAYAEELERK